MKTYTTQAEFATIANAITDTHEIRKEQNIGVAIGVYLPYRKVATRVVATVGTYEAAKELTKAIKQEYAGKIDFATPVWMPEIRTANNGYKFALQR